MRKRKKKLPFRVKIKRAYIVRAGKNFYVKVVNTTAKEKRFATLSKNARKTTLKQRRRRRKKQARDSQQQSAKKFEWQKNSSSGGREKVREGKREKKSKKDTLKTNYTGQSAKQRQQQQNRKNIVKQLTPVHFINYWFWYVTQLSV